MRDRLRLHLTYANVTATLALFVALSGSSYAALAITGRDVKNNSLTGRDVRSLTSKDVRAGSLLASDFREGELPDEDTRYVVRNSGAGINNGGPAQWTLSETTSCEPGETATGGGVAGSDRPETRISESRPVPPGEGATPTGWFGKTTTEGDGGVVSVYVICASP